MVKKLIFRVIFFLSALAGSFQVPICPHTAIQIVKSTTSLIPAADSIGHNILHLN